MEWILNLMWVNLLLAYLSYEIIELKSFKKMEAAIKKAVLKNCCENFKKQ